MTIVKSNRFTKEFESLPQDIKQRARKQLALFFQNPKHPSLQAKKMKGHPNTWQGRVTKSYRFTFTIESDRIILRRIGTHDILKRP